MDKYAGSADKAFREMLLNHENRCEYFNSVLGDAASGDLEPKDTLAALIGCIKDIVYAHGSVDKFIRATDTTVDRQVFYHMFRYLEDSTGRRGPEFLHIMAILDACGLRLGVQSKESEAQAIAVIGDPDD